MKTEILLPENDPNLQLALQLGSTLESGDSISTIQDSLIQSLLDFKNQELNEIETLKEDSNDIWNLIDKKTNSPQNATILSLTRKKSDNWVWATAATILIAAFIGIFWFTTLRQPTLIAQSKATIKTIALSDGSNIILRPYSSLYEIELSNTERTYKLEGEGFFTVSKDMSRPFKVESTFGEVTVLGTRFNLSTWTGYSMVYLEEGSIKVENIGGSSVILKPGESVNLLDSNIDTPQVSDGKEFKDWIDNTLVLKSTPITQVIAELEHHYQVRIDISEMENTSELITGSVILTELSTTLNDMGIILGGTFREVNSKSFVFIPLN